MNLRNDRELANTRHKLSELNKLIRQAQSAATSGRDTEIRSLNRLANQLREEIIRYEAASSPAQEVR